jgi:hypothetical protein
MKGVVRIFTFRIWAKFIETKPDSSSCLSELVVGSRILWELALIPIRRRISTAGEPRCENGAWCYRLTLGMMPLPCDFYEVPFGTHQQDCCVHRRP